jgi:hypothetical protein
MREQAERRTKILLGRMSPKGTRGLPKKLDDARFEHGITDGAFKRQACFERVFVWQIPMQKGDTYDGGLIKMAESTQQRERNKAPYGVIISAGLKAMDILTSNGLGLGHTVLFCHAAPYHIRYDVIDGVEQHLIVLMAGDIIGGEDLATDLMTRRVRIMQNPKQTDYPEHGLVDENGKWLMPQAAWAAED